MFDCLAGGKFSSKCKRAVKCIKSRIGPIKKKKQAMLKFLKKDVADLLAAGHDSNAFGRIDALICETNQTSCYEMIEKYCELLLNQLPILQKQRECPQGALEAMSTLIFAAARFPDLPELCDLRHVFMERYGGHMESFVNAEFVEKIQKKEFSKEMKLQLMQNIAKEFSVRWDSWSFEHKSSNSPAEQPKKAVPLHSANDVTPVMLTKSRKEEVLSKKNYEPTPTNVAQRHLQIELKDNYTIPNSNDGQLHATVDRARKVITNEIENVDPYRANAVVLPYGNPKISMKGNSGNDELKGFSNVRTTKVQEELDPSGPEKQGFGMMTSWNDKPSVIPPYNKSDGSRGKYQVIEKSGNGFEHERSQRHEWSDPITKERQPIRPINKGTTIGMIPPYVKVDGLSANDDQSIKRPVSAGHNKPYDNLKDGVFGDERNKSDSLQKKSQKLAVTQIDDGAIHESQTPSRRRRHSSRRSAGINGDYYDEGKTKARHPRALIDDDMGNAKTYGKVMPPTSTSRGRNGSRHNAATYDEESDDEEMVVDKLLMHYSKKGTSKERIKTGRRTTVPSMDHALDSDRAVDYQVSGKFHAAQGVSAHPPERAVSLPPEPVWAAEVSKVPTRATSLQPDLSPNGRRVHARLPDYDDLAARFAALKRA